MTGEGSVNKCVIEHVVNIKEKLSDMTSLVKENLERRKQQVKKWYDRSTVQRGFTAGDDVLVLLSSDTKKMAAQCRSRKSNRANFPK